MKRLYLLLWPAAALALLGAWFVDDPYLAPARDGIGWIVLAACLAGLALSWRRPAAGPDRLALLSLWATALLVLAGMKALDIRRQAQVLATPDFVARSLGRHFIIGYERAEDIAPLAARGLIGGVFVTRRNIAQGADALRAEIAALQTLREAAGLPPLIVATDQEGGEVSHLSPPLPPPPALSALAHSADAVDRARAQGQSMGAQLSALGVTMDFAPVVDLQPAPDVQPRDFNAFIARRAISDDPETVRAVAGAFARGLAESGVTPTLKHFPGLGRVAADTHFDRVRLKTPAEELAARDWLPFRAVLSEGVAALMVGHVIVEALDPDWPASESRAVVGGLIRGAWGFDGLIVTDDLNMAPVFRHDICGGVVAALNACVDLLLVSWDGRQYYPLMACVLAAQRKGALDPVVLTASARRLDRPPMTAPSPIAR